MKLTDYKGYQITTELYGLGFTWTYRMPPSNQWTQQPLTKTRYDLTVRAYSTREEAIEAAKEVIDKL